MDTVKIRAAKIHTVRMGALALAALLGGCLGTTPEERRLEEIGYEDEGPEHNPGEPCLACHGIEYAPGDDVFAVAGTIYMFPDDTGEGIGGATVHITDARDRSFDVVTNRAGNFMVEGEAGAEDVSDPRVREHEEDEGRVKLNYWPVFPLRVRVSHGDLEQEMVTSIRREGSCSECHYRDPGPDSVGRVYLMEP